MSTRTNDEMKDEDPTPQEPPRGNPQASTGKFFRRDLMRRAQRPPALPEHLAAEAAEGTPTAAG